jgi:hypothetical protein
VPSATAILDRFLHNADVIAITGKSYRLRNRVEAKPSTAASDDNQPKQKGRPLLQRRRPSRYFVTPLALTTLTYEQQVEMVCSCLNLGQIYKTGNDMHIVQVTVRLGVLPKPVWPTKYQDAANAAEPESARGGWRDHPPSFARQASIRASEALSKSSPDFFAVERRECNVAKMADLIAGSRSLHLAARARAALNVTYGSLTRRGRDSSEDWTLSENISLTSPVRNEASQYTLPPSPAAPPSRHAEARSAGFQ